MNFAWQKFKGHNHFSQIHISAPSLLLAQVSKSKQRSRRNLNPLTVIQQGLNKDRGGREAGSGTSSAAEAMAGCTPCPRNISQPPGLTSLELLPALFSAWASRELEIAVKHSIYGKRLKTLENGVLTWRLLLSMSNSSYSSSLAPPSSPFSLVSSSSFFLLMRSTYFNSD